MKLGRTPGQGHRQCEEGRAYATRKQTKGYRIQEDTREGWAWKEGWQREAKKSNFV